MAEKTESKELVSRTSTEQADIDDLLQFHQDHLKAFGTYWNQHALVTMQRQTLSRILYYNTLYQKIVGVPGVICEFGVHWGATLAQLISLRGIYEPYNHRREIIGFDTFEGFVNTSEDRDGSHLSDGDFNVYEGYEDRLDKVLSLHEKNCPIPHVKKFKLVKGDVSQTVPAWIEDNPHAVIAMAIFDLDLYQPTRDALQAVLPRLVKGSVLVFDELNSREFPGETGAVDEVVGLNNLKLNHFPHQPSCAWAIWGE